MVVPDPRGVPIGEPAVKVSFCTASSSSDAPPPPPSWTPEMERLGLVPKSAQVAEPQKEQLRHTIKDIGMEMHEKGEVRRVRNRKKKDDVARKEKQPPKKPPTTENKKRYQKWPEVDCECGTSGKWNKMEQRVEWVHYQEHGDDEPDSWYYVYTCAACKATREGISVMAAVLGIHNSHGDVDNRMKRSSSYKYARGMCNNSSPRWV